MNDKVLYRIFVFLTEYAAFMIIWIRYRHVKSHYADSPAKLQLLNVLSFLAGFLSVFGLLLVGSFQVSTIGQPQVDNTVTLTLVYHAHCIYKAK